MSNAKSVEYLPIGYFVVGFGESGEFEYGEMFIPLSEFLDRREELYDLEALGYDIVPVYTEINEYDEDVTV